jgi:hypothetical protein
LEFVLRAGEECGDETGGDEAAGYCFSYPGAGTDDGDDGFVLRVVGHGWLVVEVSKSR